MMHCPEIVPVPLIHIEETTSTNSYLIEICDKQRQAEFTTVVCDYQTAGRGQRGNSWEAEAGQNLLFSFVIYPVFLEVRRQFLLSQIVSLAIKEELDEYASDISIKWPNDIYWKEKKICGMLIENQLSGSSIERSIAGVGINVNQQQFFSPAINPVSLWQITQQEQKPCNILRGIMVRLKAYYRMLQSDDTDAISCKYQQALFRKDGFHCYSDKNGIFYAKIIRIENDGQLILKDEAGIERGYRFKEVEFRLTD